MHNSVETKIVRDLDHDIGWYGGHMVGMTWGGAVGTSPFVVLLIALAITNGGVWIVSAACITLIATAYWVAYFVMKKKYPLKHREEDYA